MAMTYGDGGGVGGSRVGIGANFAKSRLMLAKRAGYLPQDFQMQPNAAPEQWRGVSSNLARDARAAGFSNPLQYLRIGATQGGRIPKATAYRPGGNNNPAASLAYANSRIAQLQRAAPQMGGGVQELLARLMGQQGTDPRAMWRELSGTLATQAQGAGHLDPRRYLAEMGGGQRLPQLPGLAPVAPTNQRQLETMAMTNPPALRRGGGRMGMM